VPSDRAYSRFSMTRARTEREIKLFVLELR
jgi:hypothetical protein